MNLINELNNIIRHLDKTVCTCVLVQEWLRSKTRKKKTWILLVQRLVRTIYRCPTQLHGSRILAHKTELKHVITTGAPEQAMIPYSV